MTDCEELIYIERNWRRFRAKVTKKPAIQPLRDRVLIERIDPPQSIIQLTDPDKGIKGRVLAIGPGKRDEDGNVVPVDVQPGDLVLFSSKWNDVCEGYYHEDGKVPIEWPKNLHLVMEGDIIGRISCRRLNSPECGYGYKCICEPKLNA